MLLDPCRRRLVPLPAKTLQNGTFGPIKHSAADPHIPSPFTSLYPRQTELGARGKIFALYSLWACTYATSPKIQYNVPTCVRAPTVSRAPGTAAS